MQEYSIAYKLLHKLQNFRKSHSGFMSVGNYYYKLKLKTACMPQIVQCKGLLNYEMCKTTTK